MIKRRRKLIVIIGLLLLCAPLTSLASEVPKEIQEGVQGAMEDADISSWEEMFSSLPDEVRELWGGSDLHALINDYALGEGEYIGQSLLDGVWALFKGALPDMLPMLISLLAVAILTGFLRAMGDAGMGGMNDLVGFVCQCFAIGIALASFLSLAVVARESIVKMTSFIELAFPVLMTLLTATGGIASAGIFQPAMAMLCGGISVALQGVVLPVILVGGVMGVLNNITGRVQLGQLFNLSKTAAKWLIGLLSTLYFGITSLQGMTASAFDGVSIRTAKYALNNLVPIVGGMVSGTVDTVMGCAVLVKNAVGLVSILMAFAIVCAPLLKIAAGIFAFRLGAALCEPLGDARIPKMLSSLGDILTYLFAATVSLAIMFMITVGLIVGAGNTAVLGG